MPEDNTSNESTDSPTIQEIESYLVKLDKHQTRIVNKSEAFEITLNRSAIEINLIEPCFINYFEFSAQNFAHDKFQATVTFPLFSQT